MALPRFFTWNKRWERRHQENVSKGHKQKGRSKSVRPLHPTLPTPCHRRASLKSPSVLKNCGLESWVPRGSVGHSSKGADIFRKVCIMWGTRFHSFKHSPCGLWAGTCLPCPCVSDQVCMYIDRACCPCDLYGSITIRLPRTIFLHTPNGSKSNAALSPRWSLRGRRVRITDQRDTYYGVRPSSLLDD